MNTPEKRQSNLKGFKRRQKNMGGITPSLLKNGTKFLIETHQWIYQLSVKDTLAGRRFLLETAAPMCEGNHVIVHIHSHSTNLKCDIQDWIGKEMRPVFKFSNGNSVMAGEVEGASIVGVKDDGSEYNYDLWEK